MPLERVKASVALPFCSMNQSALSASQKECLWFCRIVYGRTAFEFLLKVCSNFQTKYSFLGPILRFGAVFPIADF
jgi:hypothetical protein